MSPRSNSRDTIAAVATAPGRGGVGIVRVSGSGLLEFAERMTGRTPAPRQAVFATFRDAAGQ
ncbi:partial tRNA modification GTPase MnmE, partial [Rhodocyclaceae bacterium]